MTKLNTDLDEGAHLRFHVYPREVGKKYIATWHHKHVVIERNGMLWKVGESDYATFKQAKQGALRQLAAALDGSKQYKGEGN
jgi:hypothetical protein